MVAIAGRLVWIQVFKHQEYVERASRQQERTFEVAARRGVLYDRNLRELAMTVLVDSIYAVPSEMPVESRANTAHLLAEVVHADQPEGFTTEQQILNRMNSQRNFAWVARRVDAETAQRVRELNLKGIYFQKEFKRFYPDSGLAAQVLGYVGVDDEGLGGMERRYDDDLRGQPGKMLTAVDAKRHVLGSKEREPQPGENMVLSIDANIQYIAERALDAQMEKMKAAQGTVVVQDPHTGQILALAVSPRFNPNDSRHLKPGSLIDPAVSDIYEPGSTFKLVTYSAAIDGAGVQPTDLVDCQGGSMTMYGRTLHDDKSDMGMGVVTVQHALERSSDVGAAKMALKLGDEKFYQYIKAYGFGARSGIELPSETRGILRPPKRWTATSILSLAIGQEVGVTPVQLVTMVSTIANGGVYMPPHILLQSTDEMKGDPRLRPAAFHPQNELPEQLPEGAHRVIKEMTAAKMRAMMQGIVTEGTGKNAQLNGYSSGGKTGTAQKIDVETHTYSHTKLVASFAGFAPVSSPAISIAVVIDTPTVGSRYGAETSAPVFAEVAQQVLEYLGVPHDQPLRTPKQLLAQRKSANSLDDDPSVTADHTSDLNAIFAEVNDLPADDPLRAEAGGATTLTEDVADAAPASPVAKTKPATAAVTAADARSRPGMMAMLSGKMLKALHVGEADANVPVAPPRIGPVTQARANGSVVVDAGARVSVPSFSGSALRAVVERAAAAGLRVDPVGTGVARDQAPAAGTMVPSGTEIVVRFGR
jgi:cell division protein FtsI (penicillin-binding protein 3)